MENMSTPYRDEGQLVHKNLKQMENSLRKLSNKDRVELMKSIKHSYVILDVLQGKQNFKVRCLIHNRYDCRCINRNERRMECLFCSGSSVQNKLIKDKKKHYGCQTKQSDTSQQKQKKKIKIVNGVNKEFSKENNADTNACADETISTVQEITYGSASDTLNSRNFSGSKTYKPDECCASYQCDKVSNVFVDIDKDLVRSDYLFEEGEDICKVSSETLLVDHKDIDYHLVKSVKIEQDVEGSSRKNDISVQNLDAPVFNINDISISSDRPGVATNQIHPEIKEDMNNYEDVSIITESTISIELHPVSKIDGFKDISENSMPVLGESYAEELPDDSNKEIETKNVFVAHKTLKAGEAVQREMETNLQLQSEVQTLNWTFQSDLQIKLETNTRDYDATVGEEEYLNKVCMADERLFGCTICGKAFIRWATLTNHKCIHTGEKPCSCTICGRAFTQLTHLINHKRIHSGVKPFVCTICGKAFRHLWNLTEHKKKHTGKNPFGCTRCGKAFTQLVHLIKHKRIHTGKNPFVCSICGKVYSQQARLTSHKLIHTGEKFGCSICGKVYSRKQHLTSHKLIHTGEKFGCSICGKVYSRQQHLTRHKLIHTGEKFGCSICGKMYSRPDHLKRHKFIHTGKKPFSCITCGKEFRRQDSLTSHKRIHTGEKFNCSICGQVYSQQVHLARHKRTHAGKKPFICSICGEVFTAQGNLTRHKFMHTGDKPFGCNICGKEFARQEHLASHKCIHT